MGITWRCGVFQLHHIDLYNYGSSWPGPWCVRDLYCQLVKIHKFRNEIYYLPVGRYMVVGVWPHLVQSHPFRQPWVLSILYTIVLNLIKCLSFYVPSMSSNFIRICIIGCSFLTIKYKQTIYHSNRKYHI